jgi:hypothetical protein
MVDIHIRDINDYRKRAEIVAQLIRENPGPLTFEVPLDGSSMAFKPQSVEYDGLSLGWLYDGTVVSHDTVELPGYPWVREHTLLVRVEEYRVTGSYYNTRETKVQRPKSLVVGIPTSELVRITPIRKAVES